MTDQLSFKNKYRNWADSFNALPMSSGLALNYRVTAEASRGSVDSRGSSEKLATRLALKKDSLKGWVLWQQQQRVSADVGSSNSLAQDTQPADLNALRRGWMYRQSGLCRTNVTRLKESDIAVTHKEKEEGVSSSSNKQSAHQADISDYASVHLLTNKQSAHQADISDYASVHLLTEVSDIGAIRNRASGRSVGRSLAAQKQKNRKLVVLPTGWQSPFYTGRCQYAIAPKVVTKENSVTSNPVDVEQVKPQSRTLLQGLSFIHPAESIINSVEHGLQQTTEQKARAQVNNNDVCSTVAKSESDQPQLIRGRCLRTMRGKLQTTITAKGQWRKRAGANKKNQYKSVNNRSGNAGSLISLCGSLGYLPERESLAYAKATVNGNVPKSVMLPSRSGSKYVDSVAKPATPLTINQRSNNEHLTQSQRQSRAALYYGGIRKVDSKQLTQTNRFDVRLASLGKVQVATRSQQVTENSNSVSLYRSTGLLHSFPYNLAIKQKYAVRNLSASSPVRRASVNSVGSSASIVVLSEKAVYASCVRVTTALLKQLSAKNSGK